MLQVIYDFLHIAENGILIEYFYDTDFFEHLTNNKIYSLVKYI